MGRVGRVVCVTIPAILTIGALICLIGVLLSQRYKTTSFSQGLYFYRLDARDFSFPGFTHDSHADWYHIGLFGYCFGNGDPTSTKADWCSKPTTFFSFDPVVAFGGDDIDLIHVFPREWHNLLNAYRTAAKWMSIGFIVSTTGLGLTFILSFIAQFSRIGSFVTWIVAGLTNFFLIGSAITATALHLAIIGALRGEFKQYNLKADVGTSMLAVVWIAVALSIAAGFFWAFTICCCKRDAKKKDTSRGRTPTWLEHSNKYERVPSPYMGGAANTSPHVPLAHSSYAAPTLPSVPLHQEPLLAHNGHGHSYSRDEKANAYEPYRSDV